MLCPEFDGVPGTGGEGAVKAPGDAADAADVVRPFIPREREREHDGGEDHEVRDESEENPRRSPVSRGKVRLLDEGFNDRVRWGPAWHPERKDGRDYVDRGEGLQYTEQRK